MMRYLAATCALAAPLFYADIVFADTLYACYVVPGPGSHLATIDTATGEVTTIGVMGAIGIEGLAWDSSSGTLYGYGGADGQLFVIDPLTADPTPIGGFTNALMGGLAYDPIRDKLFGAASASGGTSQIYDIHRTTGELTPVGSPITQTSAMEFFPTTGELLIADPFPGALGSWNPDTDVETPIGPMSATSGLAWSNMDNALYATGDLGGSPSNLLYTIDHLTGATINTITLSQTRYYAALTAIPAPGAVAGMALVCGGALVRRRRRWRRIASGREEGTGDWASGTGGR